MTTDAEIKIDLKSKTKNDKHIREKLNVYESYVVASIIAGDAPKLRNCLDYKEVNINNTVNPQGTTFLHYAVSKLDGRSSELSQGSVIGALLLKGADPFIKDADGYTALDYALSLGFRNNAALIQKRIDQINAKAKKAA